MNSRGHADGVCTIGRLLNPNRSKVMTVRSHKNIFIHRDFGIYIIKSMIPFINEDLRL